MAQSRLLPNPVVEDLDVLGDLASGLLPGSEAAVIHEFVSLGHGPSRQQAVKRSAMFGTEHDTWAADCDHHTRFGYACRAPAD